MNYLYNLLVIICLYVILGQSTNLVVGYAGLLSLCQAAFYGIGAYTGALLMVVLHWPFLPSLLAAVAVSGSLAWLISIPAMRMRGDFFVLATLGFQMIALSLFRNWTAVTRGPFGILGIPRLAAFGVALASPARFLGFTLAATIACCVIIRLLVSSPYGRVLQAVREDEVAAAALGKDVTALQRSAFVWAGAIAAVPGVIFAAYAGYIDPMSFGLDESIFILCVIIIGGAGSFAGPIVGAVALVLLPEALRLLWVPDAIAASIRQIVYGAALLVAMRLRPQGIAGNYAFD